jgi:amino acid adenylation domain-containing protein
MTYQEKSSMFTFPLASAQERIWFHERLGDALPTYNLAYAVRLAGRLDAGALERALQGLVDRHEALRTAFVVLDGEPVQAVQEHAELRVERVDLRDRAPRERERELARERVRLATTPLAIDRAPLVRATLVALADDEHVLLLVVHHIVFDGWSLGLLKRELAALYRAHARGERPALEPPPLQYADFAVWQRELVEGEAVAGQLARWRQRLAGTPALLELPTTHPRPAVQGFAGAQIRLSLGAAATARLERVAAEHEATPFIVAVAAYAAFLARCAGQEEVVVGTPVANRLDAEIEGAIGYFANMLALRVRVERERSFSALLGHVREVALEAYEHQDVPFERVVQEVASERSLGHAALLQAVLSFQNAPDEPLELDGLEVEVQELGTGTAKFDLSLDLRRHGDALEAIWEYRADLLDETDARALVDCWRTLLEASLEDPERAVGELALLRPEQRAAVVAAGVAPAQPFPADVTVADLVGEQARRTPDAVAVQDAARSLTYAELEAEANRLAHHLRAAGVGRGALVGVCLEPGVDVPVALLAAYRAGAGHVPLDPDLPPDRLAYMVADAGLDAVLTSSALGGTCPEAGLRIELDREADAIAARPADAPPGPAGPDDLAYVIYTSGSTGRPKGVEIAHRPLVNLLWSARERLGFGAGDGILAVTSLSFDIAVVEHFVPLLAGGRLVVAPRRPFDDPPGLFALLARPEVTTLQTTPSLWKLLLEAGLPAGLVRRAWSGGEALPASLAAALRERVDELWNVYGPTEATIYVSVGDVFAEGVERAPSLGRALANTDLHVVDERLEAVPVNVAGELVLGGVGLARGYRGRPALTAERFVPDPFSGRPGARLYRTGDLVRRTRAGRLEFLGRIDHQVKMSGVRIELGEVEAVLRGHPALRDCVVSVWEPAPGDLRLVAYVVPAAGGDEVDLDELRALARSTLPPQALPGAYVVLDALPRTPSGKVDRRALPTPEAQERRELVGARDALELKLLELWRAALAREDVGVTDSFFELGGHSLLALGLIEQVRRQTGRPLALDTVFRAGTVEAAAQALRGGEGGATRSLVRLNRRAGRALACVHSLVGTALRYRPLASLLDGAVEVHAFQAPGVADDEPPLRRIEALADRYLPELREAWPEGPYALAGYSLGGLVAFELAARLVDAGEEVETLVLLESFAPTVDGDEDYATVAEVSLARSLGGDWDAEAIAALEPEQRLAHVWEHARRRHLLPPGVGLDRLARHLDVVRAHLDAFAAYRPPRYPGDVVLVRSAEGPAPDDTLGWGELVEGRVEVVQVGGTHSTLLESPTVEAVAAELGARLARAPSTPMP